MKKEWLNKWLIFGLLFAVFFSQPNITLFSAIDSSTLAIAETGEVEEDERLEEAPVTPSSTTPWNHTIMNIEDAWADGYTGSGVTIAVLDTGFDVRHPDLNMAGGNSVFPDDPWSNDHSGHGTHIAGIIGARKGSTYQGIAPDADLYGIKIYHEEDVDESGFVSTDVNSVISGIQLAMNFNPDIIVISSGLTYDDETLHQKIIEAHNKGVLIIAASGNGNTSVNFPASYPEVIAVTAVDERMHPALDIIYGQENDFAAPGVNIGGLSIPESTYSYPYILMSGSSQAVPHAAGLAAILMEKYGVYGEAIRQLMSETALDIGDPGFYGDGLLRYVSEDTIVSEEQELETPPAEKEVDASTSPANEEESLEGVAEDDEDAVRKPISSRAADEETETLPETSAFHSVEAMDQEEHGAVPLETIRLVETGGILEIKMPMFNSLYLSNDQIKDVRDRNITLQLVKEGVSWQIPPANFLPGSAILHIYEGIIDGVKEHEARVSPTFTTSIFQRDTNRVAYPSQMGIKISMNDRDEKELETFEGYAWDKEEEEWYQPHVHVSIEEDEKAIIILTRQTTMFGIYDPELVPDEENIDVSGESIAEEQKTMPLAYQLIIGFVGFSILLFMVRFILKKRK